MASYPDPESSVLFHLKPRNKQAEQVVAHTSNEYLTSRLPDNTLVIDVGYQNSDSQDVIATMGRGNDAHIFVGGISISKVQCSFEIVKESNVIMVCDRSRRQNTHISGPGAISFEHGRTRQVAIWKKLNTILGIGGRAPGTILFDIVWREDPKSAAQKLNARRIANMAVKEPPRLARTGSDLETVMPSFMPTMLNTPGPGQLKMRYFKIDDLGQGKFGSVFKCIDVDTGKFLAVKLLRQPDNTSEEATRKRSLHCSLKREVEALSNLNHVCISP